MLGAKSVIVEQQNQKNNKSPNPVPFLWPPLAGVGYCFGSVAALSCPSCLATAPPRTENLRMPRTTHGPVRSTCQGPITSQMERPWRVHPRPRWSAHPGPRWIPLSPTAAPAPNELSEPNQDPLPLHRGIKDVAQGTLAAIWVHMCAISEPIFASMFGPFCGLLGHSF